MPQNFLPLYIVTGASGTGKTAVVPHLRPLLPDWDVFETDILWDSGDNWEIVKCNWLRIAHSVAQSGRRTLLCGTILPEHIAKCDHFPLFTAVHSLALICNENILRARLEARPEWRSCNLDFIDGQISLNQWLSANAFAAFTPPLSLCDTTQQAIEETARHIRDWTQNL